MQCPHCNSNQVVKKGGDRYGRQRYRCKDCGKGFGVGDKSAKPITTPIHYSLADEMCPSAKRALSPLFTDNVDDVTCRTCRTRLLNPIDPNKLTTNKSFSLTGEAIEILRLASDDQNRSQSSIVNDLIIEHLPPS